MEKQRVLGVGGVFLKANDPRALVEWYREHLGIEPAWEAGAAFLSQGPDELTLWSVMDADTDYFAPSQSTFMINFRVADVGLMLDQLRALGAQVDGPERTEHGSFGWVMDPEGNRVELWEPPAAP